MRGYTLGSEAVRQIRDLVRAEMLAIQQTPQTRRASNLPISIIEGTLSEDMDAGSFTSVVTASMTVYGVNVQQDSRVYDADLESTGRSVTLTNRDPSLTGSEDDYVIAIKFNREWRPIWVGCS